MTDIIPEYFLEIWKNETVNEIKRFSNAIETWEYVIDNKITVFCVYEGKCVIDETYRRCKK